MSGFIVLNAHLFKLDLFRNLTLRLIVGLRMKPFLFLKKLRSN